MKMVRVTYISLILSIVYIVGCNYQEKDKLPYKNLSDFSTSSGYIYVDIQHRNGTYTIVIDNSGFYGSLKHYMFHNKLSKRKYQNMVTKALKTNTYIEVSKELDTEMRYFLVKKELINKYDTVDLNKGYIRPDGMFTDSIDRNNQRAVIYTLLKKGIRNCYKDCESGVPMVSQTR
jgi:hypothetical protein